ncbi:MAG: AAA family ATPase [Elusimicrobia bacterium]|nr:AAA family ATPase [Elusimicrobiota bacterium]
MHLKRLELTGFKSFADSTCLELVLDNHLGVGGGLKGTITAIVGPNGAGKTNVADALRWCLGEMSAKSLRGHEMLDVIFNGSSTRPPSNVAEVSLTFDNSDHRLPLDYTEITVTRRLFRSGESEYFLNKTQCRLRDIRELFLDTGIGTEGYSLMEQGKVEFILSAKPEERRELFEEAAGVSKYKARREEALRKLERVEQDMLRLNDSLAIYQQQIHHMDAAVRKARQYQRYQEDLKALEVAALLASLNDRLSRLATAEQAQESERERVAEIQRSLHQAEAEAMTVRLAAQEQEEALLQAQQRAAQLDVEITKAEDRRDAARDRAGEMAERVAHLERSLAELTATQSATERQRTQLREELSGLRTMGKDWEANLSTVEQHLEQARQRLHTHQGQLVTIKERLLELSTGQSRERNEMTRLTSLVAHKEEELKGRSEERTKAAARQVRVEESLGAWEAKRREHAHELQERRAALDRLSAERSRLETEIQRLQAEHTRVREQTLQLKTRLQAITESEAADPQVSGTRAVMSLGWKGIWGPVGRVIRVPDPFLPLLDAVLGNRASYLIADTVTTAERAMAHLRSTGAGRATFLVLERLPELPSSSPFSMPRGWKSLWDVIECEPAAAKALRFLVSKWWYRGQMLASEGILQGGADIPTDRTASSLQLADRLQHEEERLISEGSACLQRLNELSDALATLTAAWETAREDTLSQTNLIPTFEEEGRRLTQELDLTTTELRVTAEEQEDLEGELAAAQHELEQHTTSLHKAEQEIQQCLARQVELDRILTDLQTAITADQDCSSDLRAKVSGWRERVAAKEREEARVTSDLEAIKRQLTEARETIEQLRTRRQAQEEVVSQETLRITQLDQEKALRTETLQKIQASRNEFHQRFTGQERRVADLRQELTVLEEALHRCTLDLKTLQLEQNDTTRRLQEQWGLTIEEARTRFADPSPNPEEAAKLRRRLELMGPVNLAAPEEYAQLEERFQFLQSQQQDLLKAKEDLHQAIAKINETTRTQFRQTFEQVRENFRQVYAQLFNGGEADLLLTDANNLLETGVEILAQPPGKKLQSIVLLSGGEKALTAIALLFAFFLVKPSPFCLLDEVDAPLDESNVRRFVAMVQRFAEKSQFIIITHNKRTMEMASVLYGVTMEEFGVSKILSVRLADQPQPTQEPVPA